MTSSSALADAAVAAPELSGRDRLRLMQRLEDGRLLALKVLVLSARAARENVRREAAALLPAVRAWGAIHERESDDEARSNLASREHFQALYVELTSAWNAMRAVALLV